MRRHKTHYLAEYWEDPSHEADRCDSWASLCGRLDVFSFTQNEALTDCKSCLLLLQYERDKNK